MNGLTLFSACVAVSAAVLVNLADGIFLTSGAAVTLTIPALTTGGAAALLGGLGALKLGKKYIEREFMIENRNYW